MLIKDFRHTQRSTRGNVLFLILLAVALFATLTYTVTSSMQGGNSGTAQEGTRLIKSQIVQYATQIDNSITKLRTINGCSETQISFERQPFDGSDPYYVNPNAPGDFRCHVFHPSGGAAPYNTPKPEWLATVSSPPAEYGSYFFSSVGCFTGMSVDCSNGTEENELAMFLPFISQELCQSFADEYLTVDGSGDIIQDTGSSWPTNNTFKFFKGNYDFVVWISSGSTTTHTGCFESGGNPAAGNYHFFHVLLPRD